MCLTRLVHLHDGVQMHQPEHMTIAQVAELLGESRWTTLRRVRSGQLNAVQHGGGTNPYLVVRTDAEALARELTEAAS